MLLWKSVAPNWTRFSSAICSNPLIVPDAGLGLQIGVPEEIKGWKVLKQFRQGRCLEAGPDRLSSSVSGLLDVPHEQRRSGDDALNVFSIGSHRRPLSRRYVGHRLEGALLKPDSDLLTGLAVARLEPFRPQLFEFVVARPAEPSSVAIGTQHDVERWIEQVGANPTGAEEAPASLVDQLFRHPADRHVAPVPRGEIDIEFQFFQEI